MKRYAAVLASILVVVGIVTGVFAGMRRGQEMRVRFNKRDLPKQGLHIITSTDPAFEATVANYFKGTSNKRLERLKPGFVFIKNAGDKMVVAYALTWKFVNQDGKVVAKTVGYSEPGILMGDEKGPGFKHTTAIEPNTVRCFSWNSQIKQDDVETSRGLDKSSVTQSENTQTDDSSAIRALLSSELSQATDLTVSLDGVVFDDGTFIGSNLTFFQQLQAAVNAKVDLLREVALASKQGKIDQALESIAAKSLEPDVVFASEFSADDYYRYFRKIYAAEIANMNRAFGKERLVPHLVKSYSRARPILKKE
jgi:hypothetical protein